MSPRMTIATKAPWLSLVLVLMAYCTFGWFIYPPHYSGFRWLFAVAFAIIVTALLTTPQRSLRARLLSWTVSSVGSFVIVVCLAFLSAVVLYMAHVFIHILLSVAASMLARLDLQTAGYKPWQAFWILSIFSLGGLMMGWALNRFFI